MPDVLSTDAREALVAAYEHVLDLERALKTLHAKGGRLLSWPNAYMRGGCKEDGLEGLIDVLREFASVHGVDLRKSVD